MCHAQQVECRGLALLIVHTLEGHQRLPVITEGFERQLSIEVPVAQAVEAVGKHAWIVHAPCQFEFSSGAWARADNGEIDGVVSSGNR